MATIQVRDVPDDVHRIYQQRAAAAGTSLQEYLRAELSRHARLLTPAEIVAEVEAQIRVEGTGRFIPGSAVEVVAADRGSH